MKKLLSAVLVAILAATTAARADEGKVDRSTPRRAVAAFLEASESGELDRAAESLDLAAVPPAKRAEVGRDLAQKLHVVLDRAAWVELSQLSDEPGGRPSDGESSETVAVVRLGGREVPITLSRTAGTDPQWLVSSATIARVPKLYEEHGPTWLERHVPAVLRSARVLDLATWQWIGLLVAGALSWIIGATVTRIGAAVGGRLAGRTSADWDDELVRAIRSPGRLFASALVFRLLLVPLGLSGVATHVLTRIVGLFTIAATAWIAIRVVVVLAAAVERRAKEAAASAADAELRARGIATQVRVLRRVVNVTIGVVAAALMLMQWEVVKSIGVSLLASAGIAGIVLGFAAQRTIGSLIAGIQLSATQPIRIGDVVIVEKEWGTIEEVTLTYVVVKVWDERRLIVPMTRFLEQPFENWTKTSSELHGTIFFNVDWKLPIDAMRAELDRIVEGHPQWDKRTKNVQVTDAKGQTLEVRVLVSAADAGALWDLRVDVREKLVRWLQSFEGGRYLPVLRIHEGEGSRP